MKSLNNTYIISVEVFVADLARLLAFPKRVISRNNTHPFVDILQLFSANIYPLSQS